MDRLAAMKLGGVKALIEGMSDSSLQKLEATLYGAAGGPGGIQFAPVLAMIESETRERTAGAVVLGPLYPLFRAPADREMGPINFPPAARLAFWRFLKAAFPNEAAEALAALKTMRPEDEAPAVLDRLCLAAAAALKDRGSEPEAALAAAFGSADELELFVELLLLAPVTRRALTHLDEWLGRTTEQEAAAARLAFRDATRADEQGGPLLFEILMAHLTEPWQILRVISVIRDRPTDKFLAGSELADFGERLLNDLDRRIAACRRFNAANGAVAGEAAGREIAAAAAIFHEFEASLDLRRDGPWGARIGEQKRMLANIVEQRLREVEPALNAALPLQSARFAVRAVRGVPKIAAGPDPAAMNKAHALLAFLAGTRSTAATGGFGSFRARVLQRVEERLNRYVDDLLEQLHGHEAVDEARVKAYLEAAADLLAHVQDRKAAEIVRRRAAAA